jgi:hypothetical protein
MQTGTLRELNVQVGDVVEWMDKHTTHEVISAEVIANGELYEGEVRALLDGRYMGIYGDEQFRIVSRASDRPKTWGEMTAEEKGALLLADHEGKVIENSLYGESPWIASHPHWADEYAYRVKPEPKVETVDSYWCPKWGMRLRNPIWDTTHKITFNTIDGKPGVNSIKMEEL